MSDFLRKIILPQIEFEDEIIDDRIVNLFLNLYRIELFKDGLDLILTKLQEKKLRFQIKNIKGWDTNIGCFLTEDQKFIDKAIGKIFHKKNLKIILRSVNYNVLAHEMAHALEYESGINLGEEFRYAIGLDMKDRQVEMITLRSQIKRLMVDALRVYKPNQFLSELFARYFELLSISRNVLATGDFTTQEVMNFFANTTNFIEKIFNQQIRNQIDPAIAEASYEVAKQVSLTPPSQSFQEKIGARNQNFSKTFSKSVKSNALWYNSWKKIEQKDDKK